jgi:hypothetical protein
LQTDPIRELDYVNLYAYVGLEPGNGTDPSGMQSAEGLFQGLYMAKMEADGGPRVETQVREQAVRDIPVYVAAGAVTGCALGGCAAVGTSYVTLGRVAYTRQVGSLSQLAERMRVSGATSEQIATAVHGARRTIGERFKWLTPANLRTEIYARNLEKYGDRLGPTIKWLREQGKSWDEIITSATRIGDRDIQRIPQAPPPPPPPARR